MYIPKLIPFLSIIFFALNIQSQEICDVCLCKSGIINCANKNISLDFNKTELWLDQANNTIEVTELNFHNNHLGHVYPFPKLDIKKLDLSKNRIVKIEAEAFKNLMDMEELDLTENHLMSEFLTSDVFMGPYAPEDSEPLRSLKILRLSNNALHSLHPDLFEHTDRIEVLMLDSNPFSVIDRVTLIAISTLPRLRVLDLSNTDIKTLPLYMLHTPMHLEALNLSNNEIQVLPKTLGDVHKLEWLSLSNNPIEKLSGPNNVFPVIPTLKVLHMSFMQKLQRVEKRALSGLQNLEELYMSDNPQLEYIDGYALSRPANTDNSSTKIDEQDEEIWPGLKVLEIQNNNLTRIDQHLVGNWPKLQHIDIRYNTLICDCDNQWIVSSLIFIIGGLHDGSLAHGVRCASPIEMRGVNLTELSEKNVHMRCLDLNGARPERDGSVLIGILIGVLLTIPIMMGIITFCYKKNFCGLINVSKSPADFSRSFYKRADMNDDNYI